MSATQVLPLPHASKTSPVCLSPMPATPALSLLNASHTSPVSPLCQPHKPCRSHMPATQALSFPHASQTSPNLISITQCLTDWSLGPFLWICQPLPVLCCLTISLLKVAIFTHLSITGVPPRNQWKTELNCIYVLTFKYEISCDLKKKILLI